jgi:hypothetical protein
VLENNDRGNGAAQLAKEGKMNMGEVGQGNGKCGACARGRMAAAKKECESFKDPLSFWVGQRSCSRRMSMGEV